MKQKLTITCMCNDVFTDYKDKMDTTIYVVDIEKDCTFWFSEIENEVDFNILFKIVCKQSINNFEEYIIMENNLLENIKKAVMGTFVRKGVNEISNEIEVIAKMHLIESRLQEIDEDFEKYTDILSIHNYLVVKQRYYEQLKTEILQ